MQQQPRPPSVISGSPGSRAGLATIMKYSLARITPAETAIGPPRTMARRPVDVCMT